MPVFSKLRYVIFGIAAALPAIVLAAQPDAGRLLNEQQQMQQKRLEQLPQKEDKRSARPVSKETGNTTVRVQAIRFTGDTAVAGEQKLQALVSDAVGKEFDFNGLQNLADKVTDYLKGKGYFLARAYLPRQDITAGVVEIAVVAGRLQSGDEAITVEGPLRISPERLKWIAGESAREGEVTRQEDLERAVLLINDLPGIVARSNVERGREAGTARLVIDAAEGPLISGNASIDNYGNRYTGTWRGNGRLNINDPLHIGDQLSLSFSDSINFKLGRLAYSLPADNSGLRVSASYDYMSYAIGKELSSLHAKGTGITAAIGASYPVIRSRFLNLWGSLNYAGKSLKDEGGGVTVRNKRIAAWNAGLSGDSYDRLGGGGLNSFSAIMTAGHLDLAKVAEDLAADRVSGARTNGSYTKVNFSLARLQRIAGRLSLFGAVNGQFAGKNLDSSEKFILGGPSGVRAYPLGEGAGDQGMVANIEMRCDLPFALSPGALQVVGFIDAGQVTLHRSPWSSSITTISGKNSYQLSGAGAGVNLVKAENYAVHAAWAATIGSNHGRTLGDLNGDGKRDTSRFWLNAELWF